MARPRLANLREKALDLLATLPVKWTERAHLQGAPRRLRAERFGAIAQLVTPRALVFVDRAFAQNLGLRSSSLWTSRGEDGAVGLAPLRAPLEAHLQLTNRCDAGCKGCYTGASPGGAPNEWGLEEWKRAIDELALAGVFHLALGGGESAALPWLGEIASYAAKKGLVPNLTTSGLQDIDRVLTHAGIFGQINVSLDGLGGAYRAVRGFDGFERADLAIRRLRKKKREIGINVVVTRHNFAELADIFRYAKRRRLNEIELLRFKPSGRGAAAYKSLACTDAQHRAFYKVISRLALIHRVRVRVDCSYVPMLAHHGISQEQMAKLAVYGCTGGDFLIGVKPSGNLSACSFAAPTPNAPKVTDLRAYWQKDGAFDSFRSWREASEPCRSCSYHTLCRGGCKVVSRHVSGSERAPDPECPRVVDHRPLREPPPHRLPVLG